LNQPLRKHANPRRGKTTNRRAGCGRSASPVRREGEAKPIASPYPYWGSVRRRVACRLSMNNPPTALVGCAPERRDGQRGESPLRASALRPVAKSNCVAARRGGEQQEANDQSVGRRTRFGPAKRGEPAFQRRSLDREGRKAVELRGSVKKRRQTAPDDWRRNGQEGHTRETGRPVRASAGVHAIKRESVYRPKNRANRSQSVHSSEEAS